MENYLYNAESSYPRICYIFHLLNDSFVFFSSALKLTSCKFTLFYLFIYLFIFYTFFKFINLFWAALDLCCCVQAFSSWGQWGLLFIAVRGLLIVVASLVQEHRL